MRTAMRGMARLAACGALLLLAGCNSLGGMFGGGSTAPVASSSGGGSALQNLLRFGNTSEPAVVTKDPDRTISCPKVDVLEGTAAYRFGGQDGSNLSVAYQASVAELARECRVEGKTLAIRVGVEGRLLIGPAGKPGAFTVPIRIAVRKDDKVVFSKATRVPVTVPADDTQALFTYIEESVSVPIGTQDPSDEYTILVGFDPASAAPDKPARARRR